MSSDSPSARPWPRWLRQGIWLGLAILALLSVGMVTWRVTVYRSRLKVEEIRARITAIGIQGRPLTSGKSGPPTANSAASPTDTPTPAPGRRVDDLLAIGPFFTDPAAAEAAWTEIKRFGDAVNAAKNQDGEPIDFREVLKKLGLPVPDGMTPAEAAAVFLQAAQGAVGTLAELEGAVNQGPWDWGLSGGADHRDRLDPAIKALNAMSSAFRLTLAVMDARMQTGDTTSLLTHAAFLQNLSHRSGDAPIMLGSMVSSSLQNAVGRRLSSDRVLTSLSTPELAQLSRSLGQFNATATFAAGLQGERDGLARWTPQEIRAAYAGGGAVPTSHSLPWKDLLSSIPMALWSDALIEDNKDVVSAEYDATLSRLDPAQRRYHAPTEDEVSPLQAVAQDGGFLNDWYFQIALGIGGQRFSDLGARAAVDQASTDLAQLAAALELQRRTTGQYPDSLQSVAPQFPNGLPHEVITGNPYSYQLTPEGGYHLSTQVVPGLPSPSSRKPITVSRSPAPESPEN